MNSCVILGLTTQIFIMVINNLIPFFSNYVKTLTSIFCLFLGAFIINLRFDLSSSIIPWGLFNNFLAFLYFSVITLLLGIYIIMHLFQYKEYYTSRKHYSLFSKVIYHLLQSSFVIIDLQKAIITAKPLNILAKINIIHEIFFHEKIFSKLPKNHIYVASVDQRGYDALDFSMEKFSSIKGGDISGINLYEFKKVSSKQQTFYNKMSYNYSQTFENEGHPTILQGFRPKSVKSVEIGFFREKHFTQADTLITKPDNITFNDFSSNFSELITKSNDRTLHQNTILTEESLERLGIFIEKYTSSENMEIAKELNELISPGGSLYGLL